MTTVCGSLCRVREAPAYGHVGGALAIGGTADDGAARAPRWGGVIDVHPDAAGGEAGQDGVRGALAFVGRASGQDGLPSAGRPRRRGPVRSQSSTALDPPRTPGRGAVGVEAGQRPLARRVRRGPGHEDLPPGWMPRASASSNKPATIRHRRRLYPTPSRRLRSAAGEVAAAGVAGHEDSAVRLHGSTGRR